MTVFKAVIQKAIESLGEGEAITVEAIDAAIETAMPLHVVPKQKLLDSQEVVRQYKETNKTLNEQVEAGSKAATTIKELEDKIAAQEAADTKRAKDEAISKVFTELGVTNEKLVKFALSDAGVDLDKIDTDNLKFKVEQLKADEDLKTAFKIEDDEDDDDEDDEDNKAGQLPNGQAGGYKVIDNGIKKKGAKDSDAVTQRISDAFGLKN